MRQSLARKGDRSHSTALLLFKYEINVRLQRVITRRQKLANFREPFAIELRFQLKPGILGTF